MVKGEWDGLGGMLKQWIKQRKLSRLAVDPNDNSMPCPVAHPIGSLMAPAEECHNAWKQYFETDAWRHDAKNSMRAVSAIYFHWASKKR